VPTTALDRATTLTEVLLCHAQERAHQTAFVFLRDGEEEERRLSYRELRDAAQGVAWELRGLATPGSRVLLVYPDGLDFIVAFFGCLLACVEPVPVSVPRNGRGPTRFDAIARCSGARLALSNATTLTKLGIRSLASDALPWFATCAFAPRAESLPDTPRPDHTALLQFTSGSTGQPRGVVVTHASLIANERAIRQAFEHDDRTVFAGWLPLFHDMGLIGNVLQPLCLGIPSILMAPAAFLQKPVRWLAAISRFRATTAGAPNFAYDLCAQRITAEQKSKLDLSSWDLAYNGAEPVRAQTLQTFAETFAACGFRREAFFPCYGMAESTLFISGGPKGRPRTLRVESEALDANRVVATPEGLDGRELVSCGRPALATSVIIVDPQTHRPCASDQIGEIWVRGPSVASGYADDPEATVNTFRASPTHESLAETEAAVEPVHYLRTGDLGFLDRGELFVTGRCKDLIIIRGRNHYPHDIELTAQLAHAALAREGGAAFAIDRPGGEALVLVQEIALEARHSFDAREILAAVRAAIAERHEISLFDLRLLKPRTIPKTSSGKLQRARCRELYLAGGLVEATSPRSEPAASSVLDEPAL